MPRDRRPPEIDMLIDGRYRSPATPGWPMRVAGVAAIIAVIAGSVALASVLLWLVAMALPIAIAAAVIAWLAYRFQLWRSGGSFGRPRDIYRRY